MMAETNTVRFFKDIDADFKAGGKGSALARLFNAGLPVPDGFVLTGNAFFEGQIKDSARAETLSCLTSLRKSKKAAFAIRSSGMDEDSELASFAGSFESILNRQSDEEVLSAIGLVYNSQYSERVKAYSQAKRIIVDKQMAVIVQLMLKPEISGVLFSIDPMDKDSDWMIGNYVYGLGETLVSGEKNPLVFRIHRKTGLFDGPAELKRHAKQFHRLALKAEKLFGKGQDLEWSIQGKKLWLLQSRAITVCHGQEVWNDSLKVRALWSNANFSEAAPEVMSPFSLSVLNIMHKETAPFKLKSGMDFFGNIGGRAYMNLSLLVSILKKFGFSPRSVLDKWKEVFGIVPEGLDIPIISISFFDALDCFYQNIIWEFRAKKLLKELPVFMKEAKAFTSSLEAEIASCQNGKELFLLLADSLLPLYTEASLMQRAIMKYFQEAVFKLAKRLEKISGSSESKVLLSGYSSGEGLASLGHLLALEELSKSSESEKSALQNNFIENFGHRSENEFELSIPSPSEQKGWLEYQIELLTALKESPQKMLQKQMASRDRALESLQRKMGPRFKKIHCELERLSEYARLRESMRSLFVRIHRLFRPLALRARQISALELDVFFLSLRELKALLDENRVDIAGINKRKELFKKYSSMPAFPALISGAFKIEAWAMDKNRSGSLYVESAYDDVGEMASAKDGQASLIKGFPGSGGIVRGTVRKLDSMGEAGSFRQGEILLARLTNIGWTALFPLAAAIITDVGAPLSHAVIVARELGVPAIVGCGNATMLLKTGDLVELDGAAGTVRKLV